MPLFGKSDPAADELDFLVTEFRALEVANSERVSRGTTYRDEQNRIRDPQMQVNSDTWDYGNRARHDDGQPHRHNIPLPLGKAMTVKHAFRIAGRLPDVIVDERDSSPQESYRSDAMEKIVWSIIRASGGETAFAAGGWHGSEVGASCFDLYMDYSLNMPRFRSIDPLGVYEVPGVDDPHDFQRLYRTWQVPLISLQNDYRGKEFGGQPINVSNFHAIDNKGGVEMGCVVQMCDGEKLIRFVISRNGAVGVYRLDHDYGFTPYVIIPNLGPYENIWGWADYEFVRSLVEYVPLLLSREADVLRAVAAGAYQESGTGVNSQTLAAIIRDGGVASTKRDSKIEPIQPAEMPVFAEAHGDRVMELMGMLGFTPDAAWGKAGSGSGTDRGLQLQPLLEYTAMKQLNWQRGLSKLFAMSFKMIEKKMVGSATYRGTKVSGKTRRRQPFSFAFGQNMEPDTALVDSGDPMAVAEIELPKKPSDLFDGEYEVRFSWRNMVDPDDPAYVLSELNKFQQGAQSLETTLENLGVQAPEDEMKRMESEAERFPWVRDGVIKLIQSQLGQAQGQGGGAPVDAAGALSAASATMGGAGGGGQGGALDVDAATSALGPSGTGQLYGGA